MDPADELYTVEPSAFVAARNDLVKALRRDGRREEAEQVARLRRPTATAWSLNLVAREEPAVVRAVLDAGAALRAAMSEAVAGAGDALRRSQTAERDALRGAVEAAVARLTGAGQPAGDGPRQRLIATLRAAMVDDQVAERLAAGTLETDYEAPGLGIDPSAVPHTRQAAPAPDADAKAKQRQAGSELRRLEADLDLVNRRAERLVAAARDAEVAAVAAKRAAEEAQAEARQAEERLAMARRQASD